MVLGAMARVREEASRGAVHFQIGILGRVGRPPLQGSVACSRAVRLTPSLILTLGTAFGLSLGLSLRVAAGMALGEAAVDEDFLEEEGCAPE